MKNPVFPQNSPTVGLHPFSLPVSLAYFCALFYKRARKKTRKSATFSSICPRLFLSTCLISALTRSLLQMRSKEKKQKKNKSYIFQNMSSTLYLSLNRMCALFSTYELERKERKGLLNMPSTLSLSF